MSNTPETHEAVERWRQGKINIFDEMARLEQERDEARKELNQLANTYVYKGNSVAYIYDKNQAYKTSIDLLLRECDNALEAHEKMKRERDEAREEYAQVCRTLAKMHHAATGSTSGPSIGLIEDVAALRKERDEQTAQMCEAIGHLSDIAEACQDWLDSIIQEPALDFIKAIRDWAKKKSQNQ